MNTQTTCPPKRVKVSLQLADPTPRRSQILTLGPAQPWKLTAVDLLLTPPRVDRLVAHLEQPCDLTHRLARHNQIQRPPTELRRIAPPSHDDLLSRPPESRNRTLRNRGYSNGGSVALSAERDRSGGP
jgi:hypothetical protein